MGQVKQLFLTKNRGNCNRSAPKKQSEMEAKIKETQTEATPFDTACEEVAAEHYSLPYVFLSAEQQLSLMEAIAQRYAAIKSSIINQ